MSWQIIKQPNDRYCIFSSIVDDVICYNLTRDSLVDVYLTKSKKDIEQMVDGVIEDLKNGSKPYMQFTMTYKQMLNTVKEIHSKKQSDQLKKLTS